MKAERGLWSTSQCPRVLTMPLVTVFSKMKERAALLQLRVPCPQSLKLFDQGCRLGDSDRCLPVSCAALSFHNWFIRWLLLLSRRTRPQRIAMKGTRTTISLAIVA